MTRDAIRLKNIDEAMIRKALTDCRGDLFRTAHHIGITPRELDGFVRHSSEMQALMMSIDQVKADPEYEKFSRESFQRELEELTRSYRHDGLAAIHELATIPMTDIMANASLADVKLKAAVQLRGSGSHSEGDSEAHGLLHELNQLYQTAAPRLKSLRAKVTLEISANTLEAQIPNVQVLEAL